MRLPAAEVWLHHGAAGTSSTATANGYAAYHIRDKAWGEVGYSFLIAGGRVLEGRGAGVEGAHTRGRNGISHGICMVGSYGNTLPPAEDLDALVWLLQHGHEQGWWNRPQLTGGHRDAPGASTSCPGDRLWRHIPELNRQAAEEDVMTPEQDRMLRELHAEVYTALDTANVAQGGRGGRTLRDRVFQTNKALGELMVAFRAGKLGGTADVSLLADELVELVGADLAGQVADELHRRLAG
jgi:hypothetical protein